MEQKQPGWGSEDTGRQGAGTYIGGDPSPGKSPNSQEPRLCPFTLPGQNRCREGRSLACVLRLLRVSRKGFSTFPGGGRADQAGKARQSRTGLSAPDPAAVFHVNEVFGKRGPRHVLADRNVDWIRNSRRGELRKKSISNSLQNVAGLPRTCHNTRVALPRKIHHPRWL